MLRCFHVGIILSNTKVFAATLHFLLDEYIQTLKNNKQTMRGADARRYAILLASKAQELLEGGCLEVELTEACLLFKEVSQLAYAYQHQRDAAHILRYTLAIYKLATILVGMVTDAAFFNQHFHTLFTHSWLVMRVFCLRSLTPEFEERTFHDLRYVLICDSFPTNSLCQFFSRLGASRCLKKSILSKVSEAASRGSAWVWSKYLAGARQSAA